MTKKKLHLFFLFGSCLVIGIMLMNCGDGGDSTSPVTLIDVTGDWNVGSPDLGLLVLHLVQDAQGNITGTADRAEADGGWDTGAITAGSNTNNNISITILFDDSMTLILNGTVSDANNMGGTSISYYDPAITFEGAWTATRV